MPRARSFSDELANALAKAHTLGPGPNDQAVLSPKLFFEEWFRKHGNCYFFLFKKNLKVTNIQFAELLALMRANFDAKGSHPPEDLQFITSSDFNASVEHLFSAFEGTQEGLEARCREFARLYAPLFKGLVVVDAFFGSCAVFAPPRLSINLGLICAHSGYVHSCGYNVFTRKAYKTHKDELFNALDRYLKDHYTPPKRVFFAAYSHEDFTKYDRRWANELLDGLDNVKIFVEKYYMGSQPLVSVMQEMKERFRDRMVIPEAGNFRVTHGQLRKDPSIDSSQTLWLLVDRSTTDHLRQAGEVKYFICYAQLYKNENPFHYFDENKPAWFSHTTIPHTLMGAMINVTMPWPDSDKMSVADPFVGSGTTWLELLKFPHVSCYCGDLEPIAPLVAKDNLRFFAESASELGRYVDALEFIRQPTKDGLLASPNSAGGITGDCIKSYDWAMANLHSVPRAGQTKALAAVRNLEKDSSPLDRLFLYLALRTSIRHNIAFERLSEDQRKKEWVTAYSAEAEKLLDEFKALRELREEGEAPGGDKTFARIAGTYSFSSTINRHLLLKCLAGLETKSVVKCRDARQLPHDSFDIVVTDPPYGFNEGGENERELAAFYASIIETMVLALKKKDGQLVFAVPDWSYTGKRLPYFTFKQVITQQVLAAAEKHNRQVYHPAISVPAPGALFRAPYYWESERALRRAILHFRLRSI